MFANSRLFNPKTLMLPEPSETRPPVLPSATKARGLLPHVYGPDKNGVWRLYPARTPRCLNDSFRRPEPVVAIEPVAEVVSQEARASAMDEAMAEIVADSIEFVPAAPSPAAPALSSESTPGWPDCNVVRTYCSQAKARICLEGAAIGRRDYLIERTRSTVAPGWTVNQETGGGHTVFLGIIQARDSVFVPEKYYAGLNADLQRVFAGWWSAMCIYEHTPGVVESCKETRAAERAAAAVVRNAEMAEAKMAEDIAEAAEKLGGAAPTKDAVEAIRSAVQALAALDPDGARKNNSVGFSRSDSRFGCHLATLDFLTSKELIVARGLAWRYRGQLAPELVWQALDGHLPA